LAGTSADLIHVRLATQYGRQPFATYRQDLANRSSGSRRQFCAAALRIPNDEEQQQTEAPTRLAKDSLPARHNQRTVQAASTSPTARSIKAAPHHCFSYKTSATTGSQLPAADDAIVLLIKALGGGWSNAERCPTESSDIATSGNLKRSWSEL